MKQGVNNVEWQISIQGLYMSAFRNYFWKREGSFKTQTINMTQWFFGMPFMVEKVVHI